MNTMKSLLDLALRCAKAKEGTDDLDAEISVAMGTFGGYSTRIEAAIAGVPKGYHWSGGCFGSSFKFAVHKVSITRDKMPDVGHGATPALALTSACLRALARSVGDEPPAAPAASDAARQAAHKGRE
jgi:hypothetical protein